MSLAMSSGGEKPDTTVTAATKRQIRQSVLGMLKKVDIKNKALKRFFLFTYDSIEPAVKQDSVKKGYFVNGEMCEGDEHFLQHMRKSLFVSNIPGGTKKSEIYQLFQRFGTVLSIQLSTRGGRTIIGQQARQPNEYESEHYFCCTIEFDSSESAQNACEVKTEGNFIAKPIVDPSLTEARAAAKGLNRSLFKERHLSVQMAYQKYCNPDELSNNALRIFFQPFGDVVALDQIPQQRAGYVCFKPPLPVDIIKRIHQLPTFRNRRITVEKLDLPGVPKDGSKAIKLLGNGKSSGRVGDGNGSGSSTSTSNNRSATSAIGGKTGSTLAAKLGRKLPRKSLPVGRKPLAKKAGGTTKSGSPSPAGKTAAKAAENAKENRETLP
uniref:Uncharacterized protein n=1 Tax=Anopheles atroparvus TaxID=41427 RepID=A0A182J9U6_ANOAO